MNNKPVINLEGESLCLKMDVKLGFTPENMHEKYELMKMLAETIETTLSFPDESPNKLEGEVG